MAEQADWAFPLEMRPRAEDWRFDLDAALDSVVQLRAEIPEDAFTAPILGTERAGNGIVIREDGLVLTIGYLITEASTIWLTTNQGVVAGGYPLAYDQATGFGLVQPLGRLGARALERGTSASCRIGENVVVAGHGGPAERAGMKIGDVVVEVANGRPASLADLWRRVWRAGPAGAEVQLKIVRNLTISEVRVKSADRSEFLKKPHLH